MDRKVPLWNTNLSDIGILSIFHCLYDESTDRKFPVLFKIGNCLLPTNLVIAYAKPISQLLGKLLPSNGSWHWLSQQGISGIWGIPKY